MDDYVVGAVADIISGKTSTNQEALCLYNDIESKDFIKKTKKNSSRKQKLEHGDISDKSESNLDLKKKKRKKKRQEHEDCGFIDESQTNLDSQKNKKRKIEQKHEDSGLDNESQEILYSQKNKKIKKKQKLNDSRLSDEDEKRKVKYPKTYSNQQDSDCHENSEIVHNDTSCFDVENMSSIGDREERTIFVGNLPKNVKIHKLKKWLSKFGEIETARLRSAAIADPRIPKKVAMIKKNFHEQRNNIHAYVRFKEIESAMNALQANGELFGETHHVRIDMATNKSTYDMRKAIFIGNLPFGAEEEDIRTLFQGCGDIESIRIIRDNFTGIGKGIGYVNFKTEDAVQLALQMDNIDFGKRNLRIKRAKMKPKKSKISTEYPQHKHENYGTEPLAQPFQGTLASQKIKRKKKSKKNKGMMKKINMSQILTKQGRATNNVKV